VSNDDFDDDVNDEANDERDADDERAAGSFFNRRRELTFLQQIHDREGAQLVAIYGRRRIGKTSLLMRWIERERAARAVYAARSAAEVVRYATK